MLFHLACPFDHSCGLASRILSITLCIGSPGCRPASCVTQGSKETVLLEVLFLAEFARKWRGPCLVCTAMLRLPADQQRRQGGGLIAAAGSSSNGGPPGAAGAGAEPARPSADGAGATAWTSGTSDGSEEAGQADLGPSPSAADTGAAGGGAAQTPARPATVRPITLCRVLLGCGLRQNAHPCVHEKGKAPQGFSKRMFPLRRWTHSRRRCMTHCAAHPPSACKQKGRQRRDHGRPW